MCALFRRRKTMAEEERKHQLDTLWIYGKNIIYNIRGMNGKE